MTYSEKHELFTELFQLAEQNGEATLGQFSLKKIRFHSDSHQLLPGKTDYLCEREGKTFKNVQAFRNPIKTISDKVNMKDAEVIENIDFDVMFMWPSNQDKVDKVVLFLHGFNEKNWDKYYTWGGEICEQTQCGIIFFPIGLHMQRAPLHWSAKRAMFALSEQRKKDYPNIIHSTLSNVAISMRLHSMPQRFIWSGLQTYYDVIDFLEYVKTGGVAEINPKVHVDLFAYSIGGLLSQILKLTNPKGYFNQSKVGLFCSGAVFNRLSPVSKFILDSEANVALYSFLVEHLEKFLENDEMLRHYLTGDHKEGVVFRSMLQYSQMREYREDLLRTYQNDFFAIPLKQDKVIPSFEVMNTLKGAFRDIDIEVKEMDFPYTYVHENPFPTGSSHEAEVTASFQAVFDAFVKFYQS